MASNLDPPNEVFVAADMKKDRLDGTLEDWDLEYVQKLSRNSGYLKAKHENNHRVASTVSIGSSPTPVATVDDPNTTGGHIFGFLSMAVAGAESQDMDASIDWTDRIITIEAFVKDNTIDYVPGGDDAANIKGDLNSGGGGFSSTDYAEGLMYSEQGDAAGHDNKIILRDNGAAKDLYVHVDSSGNLEMEKTTANIFSIVYVVHFSQQLGEKTAT